MRIKTTGDYHLIPVSMAVVTKTRDSKCWWGCWWECNWYSPSGEGVEVPQAVKTELPFHPATPPHVLANKQCFSLLQPILWKGRIALCPTYVHSASWKTFGSWMSESQRIHVISCGVWERNTFFFVFFFPQLEWGIADQHVATLVCNECMPNQIERQKQSENTPITASSQPEGSWGQG